MYWRLGNWNRKIYNVVSIEQIYAINIVFLMLVFLALKWSKLKLIPNADKLAQTVFVSNLSMLRKLKHLIIIYEHIILDHFTVFEINIAFWLIKIPCFACKFQNGLVGVRFAFEKSQFQCTTQGYVLFSLVVNIYKVKNTRSHFPLT